MSQQDQQQPLNIESPSSTDNTTPTDINVPKKCIAGCGFFGNAASEWHCSKCYKAKKTASTTKPPQHTTSPSATTTAPITPPSIATPLSITTSNFLLNDETRQRQPSFNDVTTLLQTIQRSATPIPQELLSPSIIESDAKQLDAAVSVQIHAQPAVVVPSAVETPAPAAVVITETQSITSVTSPFKKVKCMVCNKKLGAMSYQTCRCSSDESGVQIPGRVFCNDHRHTWTHNCSVDVKKLQQTVLTQANPEIKSNNGLERI